MKKKYRRTGSVILGIFIAAVLCIAVVSFIIYQNGLRYIKSDAGVKFFGNTDKNDNIISGRMWFESDAADVSLQKFYIIAIKDKSVFSESAGMPDQRTFLNYPGDYEYGRMDVLGDINNSLRKEITDSFPLNNIIFNKTDERILFINKTFDSMIKNYEETDIYLSGGEIYVYDGEMKAIKWILSAEPGVTSYKDFEISQADNNAKKYKDDIFGFIEKEKIVFASFELTDGSIINLYPASDKIYRINYDKGPLSGELYIGEINGDFQKNGKGMYYAKDGEIYYGDFLKDARTGKSELMSGHGDTYSGDITDGKKNGEGIFKWSDGSIYTGTFKDNMKNGSGRDVFEDGSVYEGDYVNDVKHGKGKYTWSSGEVYEGDYISDVKQGKGRYTWAGGDYYEGDFSRDIVHGWGTFYWTTGRTYEGWFLYGEMVTEKPDDIIDIIDFTDGGENNADEVSEE